MDYPTNFNFHLLVVHMYVLRMFIIYVEYLNASIYGLWAIAFKKLELS